MKFELEDEDLLCVCLTIVLVALISVGIPACNENDWINKIPNEEARDAAH